MPNEQWNKFAEAVKQQLEAMQGRLDEQAAWMQGLLSAVGSKFSEHLRYLEAIKPHEIAVLQNVAEDMEEEGLGGDPETIRGVGPIIVHQVPGGTVIACTAEHAGGEATLAAGGKEIRYGKLKDAWASGNTVTLNPCKNIDGDEPDASREIVCYIRMPAGAEDMESFDADQGDVLTYWPVTDTTGVLVANPARDMLAGGDLYHVVQKDSATDYDFVIEEVKAT